MKRPFGLYINKKCVYIIYIRMYTVHMHEQVTKQDMPRNGLTLASGEEFAYSLRPPVWVRARSDQHLTLIKPRAPLAKSRGLSGVHCNYP